MVIIITLTSSALGGYNRDNERSSHASSSSTPRCATASRRPASRWTCPSKLAMARALDAPGRWTSSRPGSPSPRRPTRRRCGRLPGDVRRPVIAALAPDAAARTSRKRRARSTPAARSRIHTFLATSDLHLTRKLRISRDECLESAVDARQAGAPLHRRCGVFGGGRDAQRSRLPVPRHRGGDRRRRAPR